MIKGPNLLFMLTKDSDMDVEGTRKMIMISNDPLTRFGSRYYMITKRCPVPWKPAKPSFSLVFPF